MDLAPRLRLDFIDTGPLVAVPTQGMDVLCKINVAKIRGVAAPARMWGLWANIVAI